ncbi:MAG: hypothetical protein FJZ95_10805, partial [Chloroflexi bacterium]|nr:hypothetical protein [Chloroflexota bacterium]
MVSKKREKKTEENAGKGNHRKRRNGEDNPTPQEADTPSDPAAQIDRKGPFQEVEAHFRESVEEGLAQARQIGKADIVVGIPFYNEVDTLAHVVQVAIMGLEQYYPNEKCVIVAVGSPVGGKALEVINSLPQHHRISRVSFTFSDPRIS